MFALNEFGKPAEKQPVYIFARNLQTGFTETSTAVLRADTCGLPRATGRPAGRGAPCWNTLYAK